MTFALTQQSFGQSESKASINAGTTLNFIDDSSGDIADLIGFYIGADVSGKLTDHVGYFGSLQFIQQRSEVADMNVELYSINPAFAFKLYPTAKNLYAFAGFQMCFITGFKLDNESMSDFDKADSFFIAGLGLELGDRFSIVSRYSHSLERDYFDSTVQLGVSYVISKK